MKRTILIFTLLTITLWLSAACGQEEELPTPTPIAAAPEAASNTAPTPTAVPPTTIPPTPTITAVTVTLDTPADPQLFPPSDPIILQFTAPVDPDSAAAPFTITPFTLGSFRWENNYTTAIFTPQNGFAAATTFTVTLAETLTAVSGTPITGTRQWALQTAPTPRVTSRLPSIPTLKDRYPAITLTFSHPMNRDALAAALSVEPDFAYELAGDETTLTLTATEPLMPETIYRFTLDETAVSTARVPLANALTWTYKLEPMIARITGPTSENRTGDLVIAFNYPMDSGSIEEALTIDPPTPGKLTWNGKKTVATFTPDEPLTSGTTFQISFDGVLLDAGGDPMTLPPPLSFLTPPPILAASPQHDSIHPHTKVEILFDRPMDPATTNAAFAITPEVDGNITWDETTLIFTPADGRFASHTGYTVTINPTARDADGRAILDTPYTFGFQTQWLSVAATFGDGPNMQVVDSDGRRTLQFVLWEREDAAENISFQLYQLNTDQFLHKYAQGFTTGSFSDDTLISSSNLPLFREISYELGVTVNESQSTPAAELIIPTDVPTGFYLVNIRSAYVNDQILLVLTRYTVTLKKAENQLIAWVTDIGGGTAAGVEVLVYRANGRFLTSGTTDENGIYRLTINEGDPQPQLMIAGTGSDLTLAGLNRAFETGISRWWWWSSSPPPAPNYAATIYTDRPIYKPDQTVFYKAIVRADNDAIIENLPEGTPVTVRIRDARHNVVSTTELATNHFGTIHGEFHIADGAMLGDYAVEVVLDGETLRQIFKVEDYRKPDYEIAITGSSTDVVAGERIDMDVEANYFFGEPVADAEVTARLFAIGEKYWLDENDDERYVWFDRGPVSLQNKRTDENGRLSFNVNTQIDYGSQTIYWRSNLEQQLWAVEVTVNDGSNQPVSTFYMFRVYNMAEHIRMDTGGYFHKPGEAFGINAKVRDVWGNPVNGRSLTLTLRRWNRDTRSYDIILQSAGLTTDAAGNAAIPFTVEEPGFYRLQAVGRDRLGNEMTYRTYVYAFDNRYTAWFGGETELNITANKDSYAPGENAQLIIESGFNGPALITFERGTTRRELLVELTAPMTLIDVPIQPDDAPNIHVVVNAWETNDTNQIITDSDLWESLPDATLHRASVNLSVPVTNKTLVVTITPDKAEYAPGEEATVTVRVTNPAGTPVSAELSLAVVDEAIFALSDDLSGPMFAAFYYERANLVRTYDAMSPTRLLVGGLGGGGGGGDMQGHPRSDFPDTAVWFPVLHTDFNGEVTASFTLPDNLTSWRLTAKAATADTQVGETHTNILVNKEVVIRPFLPRILTTGDTIILSAIVQNFSPTPQTLTATLTINNQQLTINNSPPTQTISLPAGQSQIIGWPLTAQTAGPTDILMQISTNDTLLDAVQLPLAIQPLAIPDVTVHTGQFQGDLLIPFDLPPDALPMSNMRIDLNRSIAGSLTTGLEYLTGFPYGCVEQTMSRALPTAVVGRAFFQLGIGNPTIQTDLPAKINAGIQRLYGFQHSDGGWGWWFDDPSHDYQTAWVVFGLSTIADAGYEVDPAVIERGVDWLNEHLDGMDERTKAYALYSMAAAGYPNEAMTLEMVPLTGNLDTFSRAGLALALVDAGETAAARDIIDLLAATATINAGGHVSWTGDQYDGHYRRKTMASETRNTALALSAFARIAPHHELTAGIADWLMAHRQRTGWGTTNETSFAILGLTDYLLATSFAESGATTYAVILNGTTIASGELGRGAPSVSIEIPAAQMQTGGNDLRVEQGGSGRLYFTINNRVYVSEPQIAPEGMVQVRRAYLDETGKALQTAVPGQLVQVRLTVVLPEDASYMLVEDRLPGGLEALNEQLNTASRVSDVAAGDSLWQQLGYNYKEIRGDRLTFFITDMDAGTHVFTYYTRATHEGTFAAMPAEAYAMYDPATWGRSGSDVVEIRP